MNELELVDQKISDYLNEIKQLKNKVKTQDEELKKNTKIKYDMLKME